MLVHAQQGQQQLLVGEVGDSSSASSCTTRTAAMLADA